MTTNTRGKQVIISVAIILSATVLTILFFRAVTHSEAGDSPLEPDTAAVSDDTPAPAPTPTETDATDSGPEANSGPTQYEGANPNDAETLTGSVNSINRQDDRLLITVTIDQYLAGGTCHLDLAGYTGSVAIDPVTSYSACHFSVPTTSLQTGTHPYTITIRSGNKTGIISGEAKI